MVVNLIILMNKNHKLQNKVLSAKNNYDWQSTEVINKSADV